MFRRTFLPVVALLVATTAAPAAPPADALDLVPDDAAVGIVVRNIRDLKKKNEKLYASTGAKNENLPPPGDLFDLIAGLLGVNAGIDEDAPAALFLANPAKAGVKAGSGDVLELLVLAVPFKDRDMMAGNFKMKGEELKEDKVFTREVGRWGFGTVFCAHGKHLLLGGNEKALQGVLKSRKSAHAALSDAQRKSLAGADVLLWLRPDALGEEWGRFLDEMKKELAEKHGEAERKVADDLTEALKSMRYGVGAVRVGDGVGLSLTAVFPEKVPEATRRFLASLAAGGDGSDLRGLPDGPALFAEGSRGDGRQNARVMKVFADLLLRDAIQADWLPSPTDRANVLAAFSEVLKRLKGHRLAVYQNADPIKHGLLSAVAILDTADADKFLADMKRLARLAGTDGLDLSDKGRKDDVAEVEKLIRELGDDDFDVRESASNRLALIGEPALPLIDKALKSNDAEVRRRAEDLKAKIVETAVARRKELLSKESPWRVRPTFQFEAKAEERGGHKVETARVRLTEKDAPAAEALRHVFGPDWDRVRLAAHGKQVVVLLGSDGRLLDEALANLKDGKPGLAAAKRFEPFAGQADKARVLELHASAEAVMALLRGDDLRARKPGAKAPALSSVSLCVTPDRLRLDVWVPASEIGAAFKRKEAQPEP
jgi:hypothetical protein